jgi:hypothetical protein
MSTIFKIQINYTVAEYFWYICWSSKTIATFSHERFEVVRVH